MSLAIKITNQGSCWWNSLYFKAIIVPSGFDTRSMAVRLADKNIVVKQAACIL